VCDLILRRLEPCGDNSSRYAALPTSAPGEPRASEAKLSLRNTRDNVCSIPAPYKRTLRATSIRKVSTTAHLVLIPSRHRAGHRSGRGLRTAQVPPYRHMGKLHVLKARRRRRRNASSGRSWLADQFATGSYLSKAHRQRAAIAPLRTVQFAIRPSIRPQSDLHLWHIAVNIAFCSSSLRHDPLLKSSSLHDDLRAVPLAALSVAAIVRPIAR
jgi:hypothetical protein